MESTEPIHSSPQAGDGVAATGSGGVGVRHTEYLLRKAPPSSLGTPSGHAQASQTAATGPLKEKFVSIYEQIFYQVTCPSVRCGVWCVWAGEGQLPLCRIGGSSLCSRLWRVEGRDPYHAP